jgi:hypothetical protein
MAYRTVYAAMFLAQLFWMGSGITLLVFAWDEPAKRYVGLAMAAFSLVLSVMVLFSARLVIAHAEHLPPSRLTTRIGSHMGSSMGVLFLINMFTWTPVFMTIPLS